MFGGVVHWLTHHKFDWIAFAWFSMYWATTWIVPDEKLCKGYITRGIKKVVPPKKWWSNGPGGHAYRYLLWYGTFILLSSFVVKMKTDTWSLIFWGALIIVLLDDYLFGDDEWRKRLWEGVRNRVKWQMDLPAEPVKVPTSR